MPNHISKLAALSALVTALSVPAWTEAQVRPEVDSSLKPYQATGQSYSGKIAAGSSETLKQLMDLWVTGFHHHQKNVAIETTLIKTSEAQQAIFPDVQPILEGAKLVAISHPMSNDQITEIKAKLGVRPIQVPVALDAIVLVVHHKNPLQGLTLSQVKTIFGAGSDQSPSVERWQQIGMTNEFGTRHINRYGRDATSGTYAAFKEMALAGTAQGDGIFKQPGSMSVILEVGTDEAGIGYAATGFAGRSKRVRVVPLAKNEGEGFVVPNNETVLSGQYPLRRQVYFYAVPEADGLLSPTLREFIAYVLSLDGQQLAKEEGFFPLPSAVVEQALRDIQQQERMISALVSASR